MAFRKNGRNDLRIWGEVMNELKMDIKEPSERTKLEMEAGRKAVALYGILEKLKDSVDRIERNMPTLELHTVINAPYDIVSLIVDHKITKQRIILQEPIKGFPSDMLVTKLALIS